MFQQPFSGLIYVLQFEPADWSNSSKMGAQQRHGRIEVIFGLLLLILKTHLSRPSTLMKKSFTRLYTVMTSCFTLFSAACLRLTHPPQQHFKKTWSTTHQLRTRHQSAAQAFGGWRKLLTCEASYQVKVSKCFQRHWKKRQEVQEQNVAESCCPPNSPLHRVHFTIPRLNLVLQPNRFRLLPLKKPHGFTL